MHQTLDTQNVLLSDLCINKNRDGSWPILRKIMIFFYIRKRIYLLVTADIANVLNVFLNTLFLFFYLFFFLHFRILFYLESIQNIIIKTFIWITHFLRVINNACSKFSSTNVFENCLKICYLKLRKYSKFSCCDIL